MSTLNWKDSIGLTHSIQAGVNSSSVISVQDSANVRHNFDMRTLSNPSYYWKQPSVGMLMCYKSGLNQCVFQAKPFSTIASSYHSGATSWTTVSNTTYTYESNKFPAPSDYSVNWLAQVQRSNDTARFYFRVLVDDAQVIYSGELNDNTTRYIGLTLQGSKNVKLQYYLSGSSFVVIATRFNYIIKLAV